ncbi:DUF2520 domain-containing protein [Alicyclobacillus fastidiosus]|uniref:DUF2520 domain-containing protein n=1 Tax=Alicyclobacillus fastidiosus TaxID=392011 RepID=A0ABY6ZHA4_9BACL|nr:Rossmann-like and DUF2520 domain-containing protein [Alicyclobacillus fastidiosus]WAH41486.1 DUF2520 domain-containing protein [Alicyclobacillus fastidiosus]GMA63130.1 NADP oxidoreductase [Alicyclobacillus fastidiosus]
MSGIVFVGPGRVGTALALAFQQAGYPVLGAVSRPGGSGGATADRFTNLTHLPVRELMDSRSLIEQADVVFLTVPDEAVTELAQTIVNFGWVHEGQIVVHTAGALASSILEAVEPTGAWKLSLHPLQTIADPATGPALLKGSTFTAEGDEPAVAAAMQWVTALGGIPVELRAEEKPRYHAAAVMASNAVVALLGVASDVAGLSTGVSAFLPLLQGALENLRELGIPNALTGPIERGDTATVMKHLSVLKDNPTAHAVYVALGRATVSLAVEKGSLSDAQRDAFERLFGID